MTERTIDRRDLNAYNEAMRDEVDTRRTGGSGRLMRTTKWVVLVVLSLALILLVVQNSEPVQARFLWLTADIPVVVLLLVTAAGGFVAGVLAVLLLLRIKKKPS